MTSIKLFWSLAVHRHHKQHSMSCSFGQSGYQKTMVKNENFHAKICQNLKFFDTWELYTSKESLEHVQYKFKKKKYDFLKKKFFFEIFDFFSKGGTLWCRNRQKIFFPFFKNFENKPQKWLSWDHSNINRNKVMNFGGRSSYPAETARPFTVVRAIMAPPPPVQ